MVKKSNIFGIALMLGLAFSSLSGVLAQDNNLVQLDLHKKSNNAVDLTFFTTNPYQDNVVVRKKSDNKYVVLMPKITSSGYTAPDLGSVKDLVSHVDVKSVNESGNAYTKVTLITTKPLNINTKITKTGPVTAEQQEYKTLIAEANTIKNNIGKNKNDSLQKISKPQKTNITVDKAPITKIKEAEKPKKIEQKTSVKKEVTNKLPADKQKIVSNTVKKVETKPVPAEKTQSKIDDVKQITSNIQKQTNKIKERVENKYPIVEENLANIIPTTPASTQIESSQTNQEVQQPIQQELAQVNNIDNVKDINDTPKKQMSLPSPALVISSIMTQAKSAINTLGNKMPANLITILMIILIPVIGLIVIANIIKAVFGNQKLLKQSFLSHLASQPPSLNTLKYNNIVNDKELNWQQKYKKYLDASAKPVSRGPNKGNYTFIKQPAVEVDEKRQQLEQMVADMNVPTNAITPEIVEVQNEENVIHKQLQKTIKLKGFEHERIADSLAMTHRDNIRSRFKKYDTPSTKPQEQENITLGNSILHSNPRRMKDSNLNISEVKALKHKARKMNINENDYVMSSVEEFFSILDKEQADNPKQQSKATNPISSKIRETLEQQHAKAGIMEPVKSSKPIEKADIKNIHIQQPQPAKSEAQQSITTNPIEKLRNESKTSYINGLIVKSGFNIDNNKGFYIVNLDGKSALIGRVNEEVFVLKKFDKNIDKPIQVRHDNDNVYMVKADGFKSLVEVNNDKMGVLIEL